MVTSNVMGFLIRKRWRVTVIDDKMFHLRFIRDMVPPIIGASNDKVYQSTLNEGKPEYSNLKKQVYFKRV